MEPETCAHPTYTPYPDSAARRARTPYRELLVVFGLTWLLLLVHGAMPGDLVVGGTTLVKPELAAYIARTTSSPSALDSLATIEPEATAASLERPSPEARDAGPAPASPAVAAGPQRILLLGDSMVEVLQKRLADYCLQNGHKLFPAIWYASTTASWASGPELAGLLREVDPSLVVVALGSSELTVRRIEERERHVRTILRQVGARPLLWIGPPNWREDTGINAMLARVLGPQRFFSSATLELPRGADGIHPNAEGGAKWAEAFVRWVDTESARPIALAPPTRTAPKVPAVRVFPPPR